MNTAHFKLNIQLFSFFLFFFFPSLLFAQGIVWKDHFGGSQSEGAVAVDQTNDDGYFIAGTSRSDDEDLSGNHGESDVWVLKLNATGSIDWKDHYGGSGIDGCASAQQTDDGGYILVGHSTSDDVDVSNNHGNRDVWVVKLDATGNIEWEENYGGSTLDEAADIQQTSDGGYIIAGSSASDDVDLSGNNGMNDYWVFKLDASGTVEWENNFGGSAMDEANSVEQTDDGGFIVGGYSESDDQDVSGNHGGYDYWVLKLDAAGNMEWEDHYGGSEADLLSEVRQTDDGGYILTGGSGSNDGDVSGNEGDRDLWMVKLDPTGSIEWEENHGGNDYDQGTAIDLTDDGGFIIGGVKQVSFSSRNLWLLKLDDTGALEWEENYGGGDKESAGAIQETDAGTFIVAGRASSDDGDVSGNYGLNDLWVLEFDPTLSSIQDATGNKDRDIDLYPNPSDGQIRVELPGSSGRVQYELTDLHGRILMEGEQTLDGERSFELNIDQQQGVYMFHMKNEEKGWNAHRKLILK